MQTLCVILAAGDATRMPNKLMLATPSGYPVIESSIRLCERTHLKPIIVIKPKSVIKTYAKDRADYVYQDEAYGYVDALRTALDGRTFDKVFVLAGDNIYPDDWLVMRTHNWAQVRSIPNPQLDGWVPHRWVARQHEPFFKFAGYCQLKHPITWAPSLVELFNANSVHPISYQFEGWSDVGTEGTYKELWL